MSNNKNSFSLLYVLLAAVFTTCLVVANIIAGKLWAAPFGLTLTTGVFCFPLVYWINDIVPEVYGGNKARFMILLGFAANLIAVIFFMFCLAAPYPPFWQSQEAFVAVLGFTPRLLIASFIAYLVGTNLNTLVMTAMKRLTKGKWLWSRTIGSTVVGEFFDSVMFINIAFMGVLPQDALLTMVVMQWLFKVAYEVVMTPLTYVVIGWVKKYEGLEA